MPRGRRIEMLIVVVAVLVVAPVATLRLFALQMEVRTRSRTEELRAASAALAGSMRARCAARLLVADLDREALAAELAAAVRGVPSVAECALLDEGLQLLAAADARGRNPDEPRTFTAQRLEQELVRASGGHGPVLFAEEETGHYAAAERVRAGAAEYVLVVTMPAVSPREEAARTLAPRAATAVLLALLGALAALVVSRALGRGLTRQRREGM